MGGAPGQGDQAGRRTCREHDAPGRIEILYPGDLFWNDASKTLFDPAQWHG